MENVVLLNELSIASASATVFRVTQNPWILDFSDVVLNSTSFSILPAKNISSAFDCISVRKGSTPLPCILWKHLEHKGQVNQSYISEKQQIVAIL